MISVSNMLLLMQGWTDQKSTWSILWWRGEFFYAVSTKVSSSSTWYADRWFESWSICIYVHQALTKFQWTSHFSDHHHWQMIQILEEHAIMALEMLVKSQWWFSQICLCRSFASGLRSCFWQWIIYIQIMFFTGTLRWMLDPCGWSSVVNRLCTPSAFYFYSPTWTPLLETSAWYFCCWWCLLNAFLAVFKHIPNKGTWHLPW